MNDKQNEEKGVAQFIPFGAQDKIKLSVAIVQNLIAVPTRSGKTCSQRDALRFIALCAGKRLNPFEGDAFCIGFDTKNGPSFNLVTAHQAFIKRAEVHPKFDGFSSGIVCRSADGQDADFTTEIVPDGQALIGAWCKVQLKDRSLPILKRIPLARFNRQIKQQEEWGGPWRDDPAGMIVKCAEADALRSAFPTLLGGLHLKDEISPGQTIEIPAVLEPEPTFDKAPRNVSEPAQQGERSSSPELQQAPASEKPKHQDKAPQIVIGELIEAEGISFDDFRSWLKTTGRLPDADSFADVGSLPGEVCQKLRADAKGLSNLIKIFGNKK